MIIDDFSRSAPHASNGCKWELYTDQVMGGVSNGNISWEVVAGRNAMRMHGRVSLENNGGLVQVSLDLSPDGGPIDGCRFTGIEILVFGNNEC